LQAILSSLLSSIFSVAFLEFYYGTEYMFLPVCRSPVSGRDINIIENKVADFREIVYEHKLSHHDRPAFSPMIKNTNTVAVESSEGETTVQQNRH
jgi:hypothetical protein